VTSSTGKEKEKEEEEEEKGAGRTGRRGIPLCQQRERATHVEGAKAIFSGRQISPGTTHVGFSRRRSLGYLISGCAHRMCRCVCGSRSTKKKPNGSL